ncbi:Na+/H+ antiporter subunit E [Rhizobium sp. SSA_523]|uniref:Na+/H+ antiporter subunit E n=1 Tax=Rhizobium sp. SSA_523 TaxID=2952477 RepID=UPI002090AC43|nr:Na+/H+ antiporter subunit E [Rhizobium sp. SSA_523]MCO5731460.1 Na+/H+ antiporter subunit E [Rhizobium sp. SSA_523]WKC22576.1 Na+/H+ antiporter subunit E [Rhizobium sp. SSA_523]
MLPYPILSACLLILWLLLSGISLGHVVLGSMVAVFAGWAQAALRPDKPRLKKWYLLPKLFVIVFLDIARSNLAVAVLILKGKRRRHTSGFLLLPLKIEDPTALAILAVILTSTPGSAWLEYDSRDKTVLIHVLDLVDQEQWTATIKQRYEVLLMEIFA